MKTNYRLYLDFIVVAVLATFLFSCRDQVDQPAIKRTELQRHDLNVTEEVRQVRIDFAAGSKFGRHIHPGTEVIYVIEGTIEYEVEDQPTARLKTGDVLFIPAGKIHSARNTGATSAAELATYIVEKTKPLVVMVE